MKSERDRHAVQAHIGVLKARAEPLGWSLEALLAEHDRLTKQIGEVKRALEACDD